MIYYTAHYERILVDFLSHHRRGPSAGEVALERHRFGTWAASVNSLADVVECRAIWWVVQWTNGWNAVVTDPRMGQTSAGPRISSKMEVFTHVLGEEGPRVPPLVTGFGGGIPAELCRLSISSLEPKDVHVIALVICFPSSNLQERT